MQKLPTGQECPGDVTADVQYVMKGVVAIGVMIWAVNSASQTYNSCSKSIRENFRCERCQNFHELSIIVELFLWQHKSIIAVTTQRR